MKFYFRDIEKRYLEEIDNKINNKSVLAVIYGNRMVGKTEIVKYFLSEKKSIYLSINTNNSKQQLEDISNYLKTQNIINTFIPNFSSWKELFEFFFYLGKQERFYLAIDEIHNLDIVDNNAIDELKFLLEKYSSNSKLFILLISYNVSFINKKIISSAAPLYGKADVMIKINPFNLENIVGIFKDNNSVLPINEIVKIYLVFGGLPKYYYLIDSYQLWNNSLFDIINKLVLADYAQLGMIYKDTILADFSKSNKTYLSILQAIACGKRTISEISNNINMPATTVMKYLIELSGNKNIITRKLPIHLPQKSAEKFGRYFINSFFDNFWFRFVHPNQIYFELKDIYSLNYLFEKTINDYLYERAYSLLKEFFVYNKSNSFLNSYYPHKISNFGPIWNKKSTIDLALISSESKSLLLLKFYSPENGENIKAFTKLLEDVKKCYPGYSFNLLLFSKVKLKMEELRQLNFANTINLTTGDFFNQIAFDNDNLIYKNEMKSDLLTVA